MRDDAPADVQFLQDDVKTAMIHGAQQVGRYELLLQLASGGMATVYIGRQRGAGGFERLVAIKRMHPHISESRELSAAFMDEARIASAIRHPNVVSVLDVHESGKERLLVMDYVDGASLAEVVKAATKRKVRLPRPAALRVLIDTLLGLHAAHELKNMHGKPLGVVHRDATPHNILVGIDGSVRITDFGIAKAAERSVNTQTGLAKGKFRYMAPEQAKGGVLDRRVDVFAVGIVAWELLTGHRLFVGETDAEVLLQVSAGEIRPASKVDPNIPKELEAIVMRALAVDPNDRWATAEAFADAIREWAKEAGELTTPSEVARLVQEFCGEKVQKRAGTLKRVLAGERPPTGAAAHREKSATGSTAGTSAPMTVDSVKVVAAVSEDDLRQRRLRRTLVIAAIAATTVAVLALVVLVVLRARPNEPGPVADKSLPVAPVAPASNEPAPPAPTVARIAVVADSEITSINAPEATNIELDGKKAIFDVPMSDEEIVVKLSLADGSELAERVTPSSNTTLRVRSLGSAPRPAAPPAGRSGPRKTPAPAPAPAAKPSELESNPYE